MSKLRKLAMRGTWKTLGLLGGIFLGIALFMIVMTLMSAEGEAALAAAILSLGLFLFIFLIFLLIGLFPMIRTNKMIRGQCEEYGADPETEEFENLTKEVSMSKNWLISSLYGSNFVLHRRSIESVGDATYYQKGRSYPMLVLKTERKKYKIICSRKGDYARITEALERWFPTETPAEVSGEAAASAPAVNTTAERRRQIMEEESHRTSGTQVFAFIAVIVVLVGVFSFGYSLLAAYRKPVQPSRPVADHPQTTPVSGSASTTVDQLIAASSDSQFKKFAANLTEEVGDEDDIDVFINQLDNGDVSFYIFNNTEYFFNGTLTIIENDKEIQDIPVILAKPFEYTFLETAVSGDPDQYVFYDSEFFSLKDAAVSTQYLVSYSYDDTSEWIDAYLPENMSEEVVREIARAEYASNVVSSIPYEIFYFYDDSSKHVDDDAELGYDKSTALYQAILDTEKLEIQLNKIENGATIALEPISMK